LEKHKERDHLENLGVDVKIILKLIFKGIGCEDVRMWIGFV
jgi:hypothetical protein